MLLWFSFLVTLLKPNLCGVDSADPHLSDSNKNYYYHWSLLNTYCRAKTNIHDTNHVNHLSCSLGECWYLNMCHTVKRRQQHHPIQIIHQQYQAYRSRRKKTLQFNPQASFLAHGKLLAPSWLTLFPFYTEGMNSHSQWPMFLCTQSSKHVRISQGYLFH